jgi:hypothetical protein
MYYRTDNNRIFSYDGEGLHYLITVISEGVNDLKEMKRRLISDMGEDEDIVNHMIRLVIKYRVSSIDNSIIDFGDLWNDQDKISNVIALIWRFASFMLKIVNADDESAYNLIDNWEQEMSEGVINEGEYLKRCNILNTEKKIITDLGQATPFSGIKVVVIEIPRVHNMYIIELLR